MTATATERKRHRTKPRAAARDRSRTEIAAGGIVYKRTPQGVRLALIHDPYGKWTFAKGHQEPGESLEEAAIRETREEMGLGRLKLIRPLGKIEIWFRDRYRKDSKGELIHKHIHYFLFEAPTRAKGQPQKKEKIRRLVWATPHRARKMNGYPDVLPLLNRALDHLGVRRRRQPNRTSDKETTGPTSERADHNQANKRPGASPAGK